MYLEILNEVCVRIFEHKNIKTQTNKVEKKKKKTREIKILCILLQGGLKKNTIFLKKSKIKTSYFLFYCHITHQFSYRNEKYILLIIHFDLINHVLC